jgi:hypothetical protein
MPAANRLRSRLPSTLARCARLGLGGFGVKGATAPRHHMQMSFQHRRHGIVGDCRQMKIDLDSYNDAHPEDEPIQMIFDFTMDLAELEAADAA